jgi:O-antigen/teichoic acid export membrane protein
VIRRQGRSEAEATDLWRTLTADRSADGEATPQSRTDSVVSGTRWMTLSQASIQGVRVFVSVILARLLEPSDFGLLAMALVIISFADLFKDLGTKAALIQRDEVSSRFASSIFWLNVGMGALLTATVMLGAPTIASLYREPALTAVLRVIAVVILSSAFGVAQQAYLYRGMRFRAIASVQFTFAAVNMVVSLLLAFSGFGVWALVFGTLAGSLIGTLLTWLLSDWRPMMHFKFEHVRQVAGYSLNLSASNVFGFVLSDADKVIVGRALGVASLGYYNLAQRILLYPVVSITQVLQQVLFPSMARMQSDDAALGRGYLRACAAIAMLTFPAMVGVSVLAAPLVSTVLGERWMPSAVLIAILAPVGALQSLNHTVNVIYQVKGRTDWLLRWSLASSTVVLIAVLLGVRAGLVGVALAVATAIAALTYPAFAIPFRLIGLRFRDLVAALLPIIGSTGLMALGVFGVRRSLEAAQVATPLLLLICISVGVVIYVACTLFVRPPAVRDLALLVLPKAMLGGRLGDWLHRGWSKSWMAFGASVATPVATREAPSAEAVSSTQQARPWVSHASDVEKGGQIEKLDG